MNPLRTAALFCLIGLLLIGCASPAVDLGRSPNAASPDDYGACFETWSRDVRIMPWNGLENYLTARVTYLSYRFRDAYIARKAKDMGLSAADRERAVAEQAAASDAGHEFFVTLMSAVDDLDDLDPETGAWTLRLVNDRGEEIAPDLVEEVDNPTPHEQKYFSFNPAFRKAYRIRFPFSEPNGAPLISGNTRFFELTFATAYGRGVARWDILSR